MSGSHTGSTIARRALGAVAGGMIALIVWAPASAAQDPPDYVGTPAPNVGVPQNDDPGTGSVDSDKSTRSGGDVDAVDAARDSRLAFTGGDIVGLTTFGLAAVGVGAVLSRRSRRSRRVSIASGRSTPQAQTA